MTTVKIKLKTAPVDALKVGDQVQTRDGRPARIICVDRVGEGDDSLIALVTEKDGKERTYTYGPDGSRCIYPADALTRKPRQRDVWIALSDKFFGSGAYCHAYSRESDAQIYARCNHNVQIVRVTVTEGQYEPAAQEGE